MSDCDEPCDACGNRGTHHLCDTCCEEEAKALEAKLSEVRACLAFERVTVAELRADVERLRADNADLLARLDAAAFAVQHGIREVAERQREACATACERVLTEAERHALVPGRVKTGIGAASECVDATLATPLVTEGDK